MDRGADAEALQFDHGGGAVRIGHRTHRQPGCDGRPASLGRHQQISEVQVVPREFNALGHLGEQQDVAVHRFDDGEVASVQRP